MSSPSPSLSTFLPEPTNTLGAILFASYILAALLLTSLILRSLVVAYHSVSISQRPTRAKLLVSYIPTFISFTTLSAHMLLFLVDSYTGWCRAHDISLPSLSLALSQPIRVLSELHLAAWARSSTLFLNFAMSLLASEATAWWTFAALAWEMAVGVWMGSHASHVKDVYLYFLLAQILPISFTQGLFSIAILLSPALEPSSSAEASSPSNHSLSTKTSTSPHNSSNPQSPSAQPTWFSRLPSLPPILAAFYSILLGALYSLHYQSPHDQTAKLLPLILLTRLFIATPYLTYLFHASSPASRTQKPTPQQPSASRPQGLQLNHMRNAALVVVALSLVITAFAGTGWSDAARGVGLVWQRVETLLTALGANHAVAALGWDFVFGVVVGGGWAG